MKNKVIIDLLERLIYYVRKDNLAKFSIYHQMAEDDYVRYVESVIEGLKEDNTVFDVPNSSINLNDWIIYTNTEFDERLTENEAIKRNVEEELDKLAVEHLNIKW